MDIHVVRSTPPDTTYHLVPASDEDGHCPGVPALFDDQHTVLCRTEGHLSYQSRPTKFLCRKFRKSRYNPTPSCYGDEFDLRSTHPPYSR